MTSELTTPDATTPTSPPEATPSDPRRGNLTLAAVLLAVLVVPMSISGTAVALPAITSGIGGGASGQQWVVNAFNLSFACFTLVWGSLSDRLGRGRLFAAGAATFAVGSVASALAPNIVVLDIARGVAGLGGAAIFSCGAAILSSAFDGPARLRAFALFGTTAGIGVALGPTLSGLLVDTAGWRPIFAVQAAVLLVVLAATPVIGLARPAGDAGAKFDLLGTVLLVLGLLAAMVGIVQGEPWGWGSPAVVASFVLAVALLVGFARVESRRPAPLLDLELLTHARFMALCLVPVAASFGFVTLLTYFPTFLQFVAGQSSAKAGLVIVLLTIPVVVGPLAAGRAVGAGVNPLVVIWISLGALIAGDLGLLLAGPDTAVAVIAVPLLLAGCGMGLSAGLVDGQALALVPEEKAGMAAGVVNTMRLGSEAIAVAVYAALLTGLVTRRGEEALAGVDGVGNATEVVGKAASGDLEQALAAAGPDVREQVAPLVIDAYNSAFHTTLVVLAVVVAGLSGVIAVLLRRGAGAR
ncbi:MFS transporter [Rhodococcus wratislaviensis]|uniref:MFS transporter n=1 Tax=Rhodococcus wratislaviensis TaxID=44752 RepID=UPI003657DAEA